MQSPPQAFFEMGQLQDQINRVEKYGFNRQYFPMRFRGHNILILSNDASTGPEGRLMFSFCLYCDRCGGMERMSGRFPANCERQVEYVANAKVGVMAKFDALECNPL